MIAYHIISEEEKQTNINQQTVAEFLYQHLDEYGDDLESIKLSLAHALGESGVHGGFIIVALNQQNIVGALVMNRTGMRGFIPENVLVYVAVHRQYRGMGIGKNLIMQGLEKARGDVKLHVEYQNPAKKLYEHIGFTSKYAEMRYNKGQ